MPNTNQTRDASAMAFLNFAREYYEAVEELYLSKPGLTRVLNALYFHVVESLLKAYLRAHNRNPGRVHEIGNLYSECRGLGLTISSDDRFGLENIVNLLESGNEDMAFRYFNLKSLPEPDLSWTREVVGELMRVVAGFVESEKDAASSGVAVKIIVTLGKPAPKDS
jgi:HEPN domain-containing protein